MKQSKEEKDLVTEKIDEDIERLESYIQHYEKNIDSDNPPEEWKKLAEKIYYVHASIESYFEAMIRFSFKDYVDKKYIKKFDKSFDSIFSELSFLEKLRIANKMSLFPETTDRTSYEIYKDLNDLRNQFAHSPSQSQQYVKSKEKYNEVLTKLVVALESIETDWINLITPPEYWDKIADEMEKRAKEIEEEIKEFEESE